MINLYKIHNRVRIIISSSKLMKKMADQKPELMPTATPEIQRVQLIKLS